MSKRSKDGGKQAAKTTTTQWYVDITGLDGHLLAENVFIGEFAEAVNRAENIALGIELLVASGMRPEEMGVQMGVYKMSGAKAATT